MSARVRTSPLVARFDEFAAARADRAPTAPRRSAHSATTPEAMATLAAEANPIVSGVTSMWALSPDRIPTSSREKPTSTAASRW